jgi:penicillin-binding protein 2
MNKPKIAIAVFVENAGWGGTWAAPIASLIIEKYLKGKVSDLDKEKRILEAQIAYQTNN